MSRWICGVCGYIYDEEKEGTPFRELPESWACPLCRAGKRAFSRKTEEAARALAPAAPYRGQTRGLGAGELAAVCSNLARGCEKQYQDREAALFRELADYFTAAVPPVPEAGTEKLLELVRKDLEEGYPALSAAASAEGDRGTQRICVWGEKVTRMLEALLSRYQEEGAAFLQDTQVWVCSVCGFLYVGDEAPELCPVCKVPAWKFEKVEGRR